MYNQAESIIKAAACEFMNWLHAQDSFRILRVFREKFEEIRERAKLTMKLDETELLLFG